MSDKPLSAEQLDAEDVYQAIECIPPVRSTFSEHAHDGAAPRASPRVRRRIGGMIARSSTVGKPLMRGATSWATGREKAAADLDEAAGHEHHHEHEHDAVEHPLELDPAAPWKYAYSARSTISSSARNAHDRAARLTLHT